jgi:chromosome segregation ATPase
MASEVGGGDMRVEIVELNGRGIQSTLEPVAIDGTPGAADAKKRRLLDLLSSVTRQGRITPQEIAAAVGRAKNAELVDVLRRAQRRLRDIDSELRFERAQSALLRSEMAEMEAALGRERDASRELENTLRKEHEFTKESLYRIATLERQIHEARQTTTRLIASSRDSLRTLRRVQVEFDEDPVAQDALEPLVRSVYQVGKAARDLHTVALVPDATPPLPIENR